MNTPPPLPGRPPLIPIRYHVVMKLLGIALLALLLLIPLGMIEGVLGERLQRRNEAITDITSSWGREQVIVGPVLNVPYKHYSKTWKEQMVNGKMEKLEVTESDVAHAFFLPSSLSIEGRLDPNTLHRGIYKTAVYRVDLDISGQFAKPDFTAFQVLEKDILWDDAVVTFAITDLRGVNQSLELKWGGQSSPLLPGSSLEGFASGVHARVPALKTAGPAIPFAFKLPANGSGGISLAPLGMQTDAHLNSSWADPKFTGAFLPQKRAVTPSGFDATWEMSYYGRDFPQQWTTQGTSARLTPENARSSLFGVSLVTPVDTYRNVERAIKYGILFIALVFTAFFLFEILSSTRVHPLQYVLVGAALCLFYLLLLSLSEFVAFHLSYGAAALASILLVSLYSVTVLKSGVRAVLIFVKLTLIYGFLYVALQMQDYSLLFGSIGLLVTLSIVMYATRKIDWYGLDSSIKDGRNPHAT